MKAAWIFAVCAACLPAADLKIDHATVAGRDLKKMQAALEAVGVTCAYGGAHTNHATEMALASFPDGSYLELMGLQAAADPHAVEQHEWSKYLTGDAGPCAWAVRAPDLAAEAQRLKAAGIAVSAPSEGGRQRPDGVRLEWKTAGIGPETRGTFFPFLIQDVTRRDLRAYPQGKPTDRDWRGVTRVVIAVKNLDDAVARFRKAYNAPAPIKQVDQDFGAQLALVGNVPVVLAQPLASDSWLAVRLERFGEGPCAFILAGTHWNKVHTAARTRWFGAEIAWADPAALGWWLGFEKTL